MSDLINQKENENLDPGSKSNVPDYEELQKQAAKTNLLVDAIILKNYLTELTQLEIVSLESIFQEAGYNYSPDKDIKNAIDNPLLEEPDKDIKNNIRLFKINEMVYQKDEYSTYKFASVFNSVQSLNCGICVIADSNCKKTNFYMGVRSYDTEWLASSLTKTLKNALRGQFPGVKISKNYKYDKKISFLEKMGCKKNDEKKEPPPPFIASVSCVARNKDEEFTDNKRFIQGLEKLALAMQGKRYTAVVLAKSTPALQLAEIRRKYEMIYTHLSPFANKQLSYGTSEASSTSYSSSSSTGDADITSTTKPGIVSSISKGVVAVASIVTAPFTAGASLLLGAGLLGAIPSGSQTNGNSKNWNEEKAEGKELRSEKSNSIQLTVQDKTLLNTLERIDLQLKRIDECESLGMWECAAYFLSDSQETAEMAAGTYKALMKGEKSGVETSAINFWGLGEVKDHTKLENDRKKLYDCIKHFVHPVFKYPDKLLAELKYSDELLVTASSLISGNELAIHMGLPRKSVCGFPVIEHADFGKEVVKYVKCKDKPCEGEDKPCEGKDKPCEDKSGFVLGKIFSMGKETKTPVPLDRDYLTMHTFITGSTGSGKSNTVYEILNQLSIKGDIPFLVIEPSKGEYKNVFGNLHKKDIPAPSATKGKNKGVSVYGTNPEKTKLLKINPFRFPPDIHVLEHLDRLVEIFNVCWPMYAAMPAILKDAMERAYEEAGWNLSTSKNAEGNVFPNFADLLEQIENVINESKYSSDSKGDYTGALCTRVRSLTKGLYGTIFRNDDLPDDKDLSKNNVIIDLSRVGSTETKSLIMAMLVMKLNEYRMVSGKIDHLSHITVLEEAHHLLKRTSTEQSSESANLLGKSVEQLATSIAEMRDYGEGFIIADQSPGLLDMSVIRNTNTKIILRLPDASDRELVGKAANLDDDQIIELSKLQTGVAAVYQNEWIQPVLCKVKEYEYPNEYPKDHKYQFDEKETELQEINAMDKLKEDITKCLLPKKCEESIDTDIDNLIDRLRKSNFSIRLKLDIVKYLQKPDSSENIPTVFGMIAKMYKPDGRVIDTFIRNKSVDNAWAKEFASGIKPSIEGFSKKSQQMIVKAIIWDISRQKKLSGLGKKWVEFIKSKPKELPNCGTNGKRGISKLWDKLKKL
jgi:hypothetical protein